ncbi:MAG: 50S ribosomal protein L11 methyltransferase [Chlorobiaceae bacterium]|jgi:ribosomal protein L11 methyltransferase|nr:50S ribosomal protein L11 methyltransferase [Chlorobiaceae bacterium]
MQPPKTHNHIELSFEIDSDLFELYIALLSQEGIEYFLEEERKLLAYLSESDWNAEKEASIKTLLQETFASEPRFTTSFIPDRNWNAEWEAHLQPVEISDRFLIVQHQKEYAVKPGQLVIAINPKMSFGTGYHATTRLMLRQMEEIDLADRNIMDIGTGTGVLAIAARMLGNRNPILAFDNNAWSAENAVENVAENKVADIRVELLDAEEELAANLEDGFDLILANINKNVHDRILPVIRSHAPEALVLLSGILIYDEPWLKQLVRRLGYTISKSIYEEEWLSAFLEPVN